jgi:hypothetical protein
MSDNDANKYGKLPERILPTQWVEENAVVPVPPGLLADSAEPADTIDQWSGKQAATGFANWVSGARDRAKRQADQD